MKQTNYHLFDFLDFDPELKQEESLWKSYTPTRIEVRDGAVYITVPYQKQVRQNDMLTDLSEPQREYTLILKAYTHNVVRLFTSFDGTQPVDQDDMLCWDPSIEQQELSVEEDDGFYWMVDGTGEVRATLNCKEPVIDFWSDLQPAAQPTLDLKIYPEGAKSEDIADGIAKSVNLSAYDHFSPPRYDALPLAFVERNNPSAFAEVGEKPQISTTLSFECAPDECFVGTGERFTKMDLSGRTFQLKNQDGQGVNNRRCYKNIPFYLSSRMYGVFYHTTSYCKLSFADHSTRSVQYLVEEPVVDAFIIGGQTPERILHSYRSLTGFPPMLPLWSFGIWMSRMTYFSADEVNAICDRMRQEHYPCDVIHLDTGWFKTDWLCEWKFNEERFPDPMKFIHDLKDKGYRVSLWQLPYVAEDAEQITEARANHYIAEPQKTELQQTEEGRSNFSSLDYAGTIDFTSPAATAWYKGLLKRLLDMGVTCIKTDFGENIHMDAKYFGMPAEKLNNLYALLYQKAAFEVTKEVCENPEHYSHTGESLHSKLSTLNSPQGIVWARSAWAGCQRYPLHWGGDSAHSWDGLAGSLKGGLHFGLSGFSFWSHDVPGFHSIPNFMNSPLHDDIYVRWTQLGVFSSHMRYHGSHKREPWHYPAIAPIVKRWWKLRYRLMPYIYSEAQQTTTSGYPMVKALLFEHPDDTTVWHIDDEYYFGSQFLCCPVMNSQNRRDIYLPAGQWVNFLTGERIDAANGLWLKRVHVPLDQMPIFVRPGAEILIYPDDVDCTDQMDLTKAITLRIDDSFSGFSF